MKVTVLVTTYNDERFIAQAINSVLMQATSFDYEIIIIEDCSTDSTQNIVIDFQKRYPSKIRLVLAEKNQNDNGAWGKEILGTQSQYLALLDGDDYWTSPHKLQRQVDFLDSHPECSICFHGVTVFYEDGNQESWISGSKKEISTIEDLLAANFIQTCSAMFRQGLFDNFPDWFYTEYSADWLLHIFNAQHGNIGYINEVMGAYRRHSGGIWSGLSPILQRQEIIKFYEVINIHLNFRYEKIIKAMISREYCRLAGEYEKSGDLANARASFIKGVIECPFYKRIPGKNLYTMFLGLYALELYKFVRALRKSIRSITLAN